MTLREWLHAKNLLQKQFAELSGVSEPTLSRILKGKVSVNLADAAKIIATTKGKVAMCDLLRGAPKRQRRRAA